MRQFELYDAAVAELDGIEPVARDPRDTHAHHLYVVRIDAERAGATRDEYRVALAEENIGTSIHFLPVHRLTAYRERYPDQTPLPVAERAGAEVLSLPLSPAHSRRHPGRDRRAAPRARGVHRVSAPLDPRRARRSSSPASAPPTSSGRSTSARRSTSSRNADLGYFFAAGRDHGRHRLADGLALAAAARRPRDPRPPRLADARVLHRLHGRPGAADLDRRRRDADLRDVAPASRATAGRSPASVLLERALGGAATVALAAIGFVLAIGRYDVGAYLWVELGFVARDRRARGRPLLAPDAARRSPGPCRCCAGSGSSARSAPSTRGSTRTADHPWLLVGVCVLTLGDPGRPRARDLARPRSRSGSTSRRASTT